MTPFDTFKKPWNSYKYVKNDILAADSDRIIIYNGLHKNSSLFVELFGFDSVYSIFLDKKLFLFTNKNSNSCFNLHTNNVFLGLSASYSRVLIIRGIGFRGNIVNNNLLSSEEHLDTLWDFPHSRYILVRAGHSHIVYMPLPDFLGIRTLKKDRKVVIYSVDKNISSSFAKKMYNLRPPSVYTGRGIRIKKSKVRRKMGKKDARKGRFF